MDRRGRAIYKRRVFREQLLSVVGDNFEVYDRHRGLHRRVPLGTAVRGARARVTIISPQYVKPFVRRQKNDGNDAEAIVTAPRRPHIPHVPKKTTEQQDIQALHRARQRIVNHRTAVVSQIRGLLLDRGFCLRQVDHASASNHPGVVVRYDQWADGDGPRDDLRAVGSYV